MSTALLGGSLRLADDLTLRRMGYGAMQLAGPGVWGPPSDRGEAIAVLRKAVERGITHIDTSDYYAPRRWARPSDSRLNCRAVHRPGGVAAARADPAPRGWQRVGRAAHRGAVHRVGCLRAKQLQRCVPIRQRTRGSLRTGRHRIHPILSSPGGFTPLQSAVLDAVAARLGASPRQVALAWLLQHSPTILLIPGTSSVAHLRENIAAAEIELPADAVEELDRIGARSGEPLPG
jgi:pyridoxine 4-dehydrogenase